MLMRGELRGVMVGGIYLQQWEVLVGGVSGR